MTYLGRAKRLAQECHAGQVDKAGYDYIDHVERVADAVKGDVDAEIVAWLHDVLEDGAEEFAAQVFGFNNQIVDAVVLLTRRNDVADDVYYERIKNNHLALKVKLADIQDNMNDIRLGLLDNKTAQRLRKKYTKALNILNNVEEMK